MLAFFSTIHVVLCIFMIFVILLQPGKDAGMGAALGGGAATSAFGGRGAVTFLSKVTAATAVAYFLTSLGLSFVGLKTSVGSSLAEEVATTPPAQTAPATPGTEAPAAPAPTAGSGDPAAAPGAPAAPEQKPGATDAVPAEKLPPATP